MNLIGSSVAIMRSPIQLGFDPRTAHQLVLCSERRFWSVGAVLCRHLQASTQHPRTLRKSLGIERKLPKLMTLEDAQRLA